MLIESNIQYEERECPLCRGKGALLKVRLQKERGELFECLDCGITMGTVSSEIAEQLISLVKDSLLPAKEEKEAKP